MMKPYQKRLITLLFNVWPEILFNENHPEDYANNLTNNDSEVEEGLKKRFIKSKDKNCIIKCKY